MNLSDQDIQRLSPLLRDLALRYAPHLSKCQALEPDDLVQEAWLTLLQTQPTDADSDLITLASNAMQEAIRRYSCLVVPLSEIPQELCAILPQDNQSAPPSLDCLSPRQQYILHRLFDTRHPVSRPQLARQMGLSTWAIYKACQRAIARLKKK